MEYAVTTFYKFIALPKDELAAIQNQLKQQARNLEILGLILIAEEGINATIAGSSAAIAEFKVFLNNRFGDLRYKDSVSSRVPFKRFKVKVKEEIVHLGRRDIRPQGSETHVTPEEWDALVAEPDAIVIDVRNEYETKIGTFKNAVDPKTSHFSEFPEWLAQSNIPKDATIGIFCTGGIRCEKAAVAMQEQGYQQVHQLEGGILNYIEKRPHQNFVGECFVFDHRSAVGQDLLPSKQYAPCWSCGNSGSQQSTCSVCEASYQICHECAATLPVPLCSKNCRYQHSYAKPQMDLTLLDKSRL